MNKVVRNIIITVVVILLGFYIWSLVSRAITGKEDSKVLRMWIGQNEEQESFWKEMETEWNKSGKGMKLSIELAPAANSSEEAILNSIASRTSPDICAGIFSGFGIQLASLNAIYNLRDFDGYGELIEKREMQRLMENWTVNNETYVFPVYANPVLIWWRWDILQKFGWKHLPETYSDILKLCKQVTVPHKRYALRILGSISWWSRWSDFIAYYYAASGGKPYIENNKAVFDNKYGKEVLAFFETMFLKKNTLYVFNNKTAFFEGSLLGEPKTPRDVEFTKRTFPKILEKVKIGSIPVPDNYKGKKYSFCDAKGLVIFKLSKHPKEAWKFIQWVFSQDKYSRLWLEYVGMPPVRGDLTSNPLFQDFYKNHKLLYEYAKYLNTAVPPALTGKTVVVQDAMTNYLIEPIVFHTESVDNALKNCVNKIDKYLAE